MFCKQCGVQIEDNSNNCPSCGADVQSSNVAAEQVTPQQTGQVPEIPNRLVQSILVTLFCCLPFGIAAIVYAAQVNSKLSVGDYEGAMESSRKATTFCWWAFGLGLAGTLIYFAMILLGAIGAGTQSMAY